ncbi:adenylate/guanylate cyclase domain-containing protein [Aeromicrobium ginsengisoli]|uniref:Adenylate/guanylate cyclase domain-containing protein n=1 Tax=Aeromicrobium ginsengisoli TaxID=363867 RepID=A0A5M4FK27_9ACTN|nr:adenylate/guanylate cyclase domain-containing protein [Aeromicrobium ginsengisoli]KAA1400308.1 adenylate/guanylate cyclase domain-containing protein [Aeromicrobium ginsengisoli]
MTRTRDPAHALRLAGLRFENRDTERAYRRWRIDTVTPFVRVGYIGSTPSWILLLVAMIVLDPDAAHRAAGWVVGWIFLLLVLTALTAPPELRRTVMPLAAAANCLAGFLVVWLTSEVALTGEVIQTRAGVMIAGLLVVMFFGFGIFRIPPGMAMAAVTPYALFGSYQLLQSYNRDELNGVESASLAAAEWIAYLGCLMVCVVIEVVERRAFCKDQIIDAQQQELRHSRETIRRYVPRAVFEHIINGDTVGIDVPTRRRVTVLFADLVGFTDLADRVEAEILTQVVNDYMTTMSQLVDEHGGLVNEFAGDGLMALFGAPDEMEVEEQAASAVRAAQAMQNGLPSLNGQWQRLGVTGPMRMRIGIDTGVLSVGSFGSEGRMTYTAIGLHTNIAARLQAHCEPGRILLSDYSWHLVKDRIFCEPVGEVQCKGVHYPVPVYSPSGAPGLGPTGV